MRQHESTSAAEHLRMMAKRNSTLESKVTVVTGQPAQRERAVRVWLTWLSFLQLDDVKGELLERLKLLPVVSSRVSELENANDELREKNRQMEQKLATMQVGGGACAWKGLFSFSNCFCESDGMKPEHAFISHTLFFQIPVRDPVKPPCL